MTLHFESLEALKQIFKEEEENERTTAEDLKRQRLELQARKIALEERKQERAEQIHQEKENSPPRVKKASNFGIIASLLALLLNMFMLVAVFFGLLKFY
jgi:hypothetical protein